MEADRRRKRPAARSAKGERKRAAATLKPRLRVELDDRHALGPGKADLLESIARERSLAAAAKSLGMSYMRAWRLVGEMNDLFARPLVELVPGARGGATLTPDGRRALALYREMEHAAARAAGPAWRKLRALVERP